MFKKITIVGVFLLANLTQFWPFYLKHLLPFPGDILVAFYFPWSGGGFAGFNPWTTYKALNTVDVIKQFYPWKDFATSLIHSGIWPMWNPYSFSGMPFIANLQSGIFFPTNIVYMVLPTLWGWVGTVLFDLVLFGIFTYVFLRSEKLSKLAAAFGAIVAMNLSYLTLWHWQLVITESALFLPLILYLVNVYAVKKKIIYPIAIAILFAWSFFGGHAQTLIYVYLIFFFFALYRKVPFKGMIIASVLPLFIAAAQILPSIEAYLLSAREGTATKELFAPFVFPWRKVISIIAPNFFGHPTNRNYFGADYRDFCAYFGATAFIFSVLSLNFWKTVKSVRFFIFLAVFGFLFATWPLAFIFDIFNVPILSSGVPARMIFVFQFAGGILAAFGFEYWLKRKERLDRGTVTTIIFVGFCLLVLWILALLNVYSYGSISRNSLILPSIFIFGSTACILLKDRLKSWFRLAIVGIFFLAFVQYAYFFEQYNSFAPEKFVFPSHPVISYLQKNAGINRFTGTEQAKISYDFSVYYRLYDFEGYDSMYPKRYGEFIASAIDGKIPVAIPRSDAFINSWVGKFSERALNILGVKYLTDKYDNLTPGWEPEIGIFPHDKYQLVWQESKWMIYERKTVLDRAVLFNSFVVEKDKQKILDTLYDDKFDFRNSLVLEEKPEIVPEITQLKSVKVLTYEPNSMEIQTVADKPQLLFVSDNYYPGWKAWVDGKEVKILRADYTFRAVPLSAGNHTVVFKYQPWTIPVGAAVTAISLIIIACFVIKQRSLRS